MLSINRTNFFTDIRTDLFGGKLTQRQVEGHTILLNTLEPVWQDKRWIAYALATAMHETAATMEPILEKGGPAYFKRRYDKDGARPHVAQALGNTMPGDGARFAGRGYVQITGRRNYDVFSKRLGIDLVNYPDLAKLPDIAAKILLEGMQEGIFTGRALRHYFNDLHTDWIGARKIINGQDAAQLIAGYAQKYYFALEPTV